MKIKHRIDYRILREAAYPSQADFADAMYWDSKGDPTKLQEYYDKCEAVKLKYPKDE